MQIDDNFKEVMSSIFKEDITKIENNYELYYMRFLSSVDDNIIEALSSSNKDIITKFLNYIIAITKKNNNNIEKMLLELYNITEKFNLLYSQKLVLEKLINSNLR